jgi:hypothetical protein
MISGSLGARFPGMTKARRTVTASRSLIDACVGGTTLAAAA